MRTHNYLARIDDEIWLDLKRVKQLDGRSINSLLMEGARKIRDQKLMELSEQRKRRNSLEAISTSFQSFKTKRFHLP